MYCLGKRRCGCGPHANDPSPAWSQKNSQVFLWIPADFCPCSRCFLEIIIAQVFPFNQYKDQKSGTAMRIFSERQPQSYWNSTCHLLELNQVSQIRGLSFVFQDWINLVLYASNWCFWFILWHFGRNFNLLPIYKALRRKWSPVFFQKNVKQLILQPTKTNHPTSRSFKLSHTGSKKRLFV